MRRAPNRFLGRLIAVTAFIGLAAISLGGQENDGSDEAEESATEAVTEESGAETARKLREKQLDTLRFGIDTEVSSLLTQLLENEDASFNDELGSVLDETRSAAIAEGVYRLWSRTGYDRGVEKARADIRLYLEDEKIDEDRVLSAVAYVASLPAAEASGELYELATVRDAAMAAAAVRALGKMGDPGQAAVLLERLRDEDPEDAEDLYGALILALGDLGYTGAADDLISIVEDEGAAPGHRRFSCISLGKIGREIDFPVVETIYYESEDALLRSYALAGLTEFPDTAAGADMEAILIQALKRDSFWRIRVNAAEGLGKRQVVEAAALLRYKSLNDPVPQVRTASLGALGTIDIPEGNQFLRETYADEALGVDVRLAALGVLLENHTTGTVETVSEVMESRGTTDPQRFFEFTARELSKTDWPALGPLYDAMLDDPNWLIQVYGIRGIRRNDIASLRGRVEALDRDGVDGKVRREAAGG